MRLPVHEIKKIALFRALYLGDMLCAVPALRALRPAFPNAEISLIGLPWSVNFVKRFSKYVDRTIIFPGYPGLPEQMPDNIAFLSFMENMQKEHFDLALQMQGNGSIINRIVKAFDATHIAGFYQPDYGAAPSPLFMPYPEGKHEINRHLCLMEFLGIPLQGTFLEFPIMAMDQEDVSYLKLPVVNKQYVCLHPGSRSAKRQWPPKYFASVGDYAASNGFKVVITGTSDEISIAKEVMKYMKHDAINLTGKTSLGAVAVIIKNAHALISNCTGISHIAAAMKTPSVIISLDDEPERWSPLNKELHHVLDWNRSRSLIKTFDEVAIMIPEKR